jgi:hypothetical protein
MRLVGCNFKASMILQIKHNIQKYMHERNGISWKTLHVNYLGSNFEKSALTTVWNKMIYI